VDLLRRMGFKVFYGDATRLDILHSAGAGSARILFIAIDSPATVSKLVETVNRHFPQVQIMARAGTNLDAQELLDLGVNHVYRDFLDTSMRAGVDVLASLGYRRYSATRAGQNFMKYDEAAMRHLAPHRHDPSDYISSAKEQIRLQEQLLASDRASIHNQNDQAWDTIGPVTAAEESGLHGQVNDREK
jgi:CPA2 family monovalent cation:H+ antiporter-2